MGSIVDKLVYLKGTKPKIRVGINRLGGELSNQIAFRSYAAELERIYQSLPKVNGEGTDVSLTPTRKGGLNLVPKGNSGKNLFPLQDTETKNGVTFTRNADGTFNISGTASANTQFLIIKSETLTAGTYTLSKNKGGTNLQCYIQDYNGGSFITNLMSIGNSTYENQRTATISPTGNTTRFTIQILSGVTINLTNVEIQLEEGSTASEYEAYKDVTGENGVVITGKNGLDALANSFIMESNITSNNKDIGTVYMVEGITYYISYNMNTENTNERNTPRIVTPSLKNNYQFAYNGANKTAGRKKWTYTATETGIHTLKYWTRAISTDISISNFMVTIVDDTDYVAYQGQQVLPLSLGSIHLATGDGIEGITDDWNIERADETSEPITDSTLIEQLNTIYEKAKSYDGQTTITSTYASGNAQMIIGASALKGE